MRPIKVRDKRTNEIIEFEWDDPAPPTRDDIDRIVSERRSKPIERAEPDIEPGISTPRFGPIEALKPSSTIRDEITSQPNLDRPPDFRSEVTERFLPQPDPLFTRSETPTFRGEAGRLYNWATTPLMPDVEDSFFSTIDKYDPTGIAEPIARFAAEGTTSPLGLISGGLGSFAALKSAQAINAVRKGTKTAGKVADKLDDIARVGSTKLDDIANQTDITAPPSSSTPTRKPRVRLVMDAEGKPTYVPIDDAVSQALPAMEATIPKQSITQPGASLGNKVKSEPIKLPSDLAGAKPRFNIGQTSYQPQFENDLDKALFIIAQKNPSKHDARYLDFVMKNTGMSEQEARQVGAQVRTQLHSTLKGRDLMASHKVGPLYNPQSNVGMGVKADDIIKTDEGKQVLADLRKSMAEKAKIDNRTTSPITGNESGAVPELTKKAALQDFPETGVAPAAQVEQSINEFVPKSAKEALEMADAAEKRLKEAGKPPNEARRIALEILNFPKSTWASLDLSAPLRQGKGLIYRPEYWTSLDDMFKAGYSEQGAFEVAQKIRTKKLYPLMEKYNPGLVGLKKGGRALEDREEAIMSTWAEHIPSLKSSIQALVSRDKSKLQPGIIHATNRAYEGFLNTLRADTFENMILNYEKMGMNPYDDPKLLKATANFVASATGRGDLGKLNALGAELNSIVFSPRFVKSRFDMMLTPAFSNAPRAVKIEAMKSNLAVTAYWAAMATAAKAGGADIDLDMTSSDFGKIKMGNTRVDTMGGLQQPMVATIRFLSGKSTSPTTNTTTISGEGYRADTRIDTAVNFARTKLAPFAGFTWDLAKGRTITGKKTTDELKRLDANNYVLRALTPNMISTMHDLYQEDPKWMMTLGIPALFGESVQVFDPPRPQQRRKVTASSYNRKY